VGESAEITAASASAVRDLTPDAPIYLVDPSGTVVDKTP